MEVALYATLQRWLLSNMSQNQEKTKKNSSRMKINPGKSSERTVKDHTVDHRLEQLFWEDFND